jgi:hypothetical protein
MLEVAQESTALTVSIATGPLIFRFSQGLVWRGERFCQANDD